MKKGHKEADSPYEVFANLEDLSRLVVRQGAGLEL